MATPLKLKQGQVWKLPTEYIRIVHLERLEVEFKVTKTLTTREGDFHHTSKKAFCRLLKHATLMTDAEIKASWYQP